MKFEEAVIGQRVVLVEPMNDEQSNEVRYTFYERAEGVGKFSPKYCPAVSLRTIQGNIGMLPHYDSGEHRTKTEVPGALPVSLPLEVKPWLINQKKQEASEYEQLRAEIATLRAGHAETARLLRFYEEQHLAKKPPAIAKARLNAQHAERCEKLSGEP